MMTTMAALLGAVPLAFGSGVGSELRKPLGICIIGGLLVSQVLTLFTTPVIYLYFGAHRGLGRPVAAVPTKEDRFLPGPVDVGPAHYEHFHAHSFTDRSPRRCFWWR